MKVQRRPTRRDYRGDTVSWTYWVTLPKQGVLDFARVGGLECWARARSERSLSITRGSRPPGVARRVRIRRVAYIKNGKMQESYAMTIPAVFTVDLKPGMEAKCEYGGDFLALVFGEPVFGVHIQTRRRAIRMELAQYASCTRSVA